MRRRFERLFEKWVVRATRRPERPQASRRHQHRDCSSRSHPFRPASCRTAQAGSLCYPTQILSEKYPNPQSPWRKWLAGLFAFGWGWISASTPIAAEPATPSPAANPSANLPLKKIEPGVFEIGRVRLDKNQQTVTFPAVMNMDQGLVEYALVSAAGKLHESLLRTEVEPYHIHLAFLLIGTNSAARAAALSADTARPKRDDKTAERPPFVGNAGEPLVHRTISGEKVSVWVSWQTTDSEKRCRVEDLLFNLRTKSPVSRGDWIYNGSRILDGNFLGQRDGSIIAVIEDLDALINNPRPGRENDEIWQVNSTNAPAAGTATQVTIKLENPAQP